MFGESGLLKNKSVLLVTHNGTVLPNFFFLIADAFPQVKHLSSADNIVVLAAGRVEYQGSPENYELPFDISDSPKTGPSGDKQGQGLPVEHVTEVEEEEAPLQKSSIGWVPYTFFARMSSWKQVWLVVVSSL